MAEKSNSKAHYTLEQYIFMVEKYFKYRSCIECIDKFKEKYPNYPAPRKTTIYRTVERFRTTGTVEEKKKGRSLRLLDDITMNRIRQWVIKYPELSIRELSAVINVSYRRAQRAIAMVKNEQKTQNDGNIKTPA